MCIVLVSIMIISLSCSTNTTISSCSNPWISSEKMPYGNLSENVLVYPDQSQVSLYATYVGLSSSDLWNRTSVIDCEDLLVQVA